MIRNIIEPRMIRPCIAMLLACALEPLVAVAQVGFDWHEATPPAPWAERCSHTSVVFDGKIWVMGGTNGSDPTDYLNDVWWSEDGVNWTEATPSAGWSGRQGHASVVFDGKMWVMGGYYWDGASHFYHDVWSSVDGETWEEVAEHADWSPRVAPCSVVHDGKIWVLGGHGVGGYWNDVWSSPDGVSWTEATGSAPWPGRYDHTALVYGDKIWVIGGGSNGNDHDDVWYSSDGATWIEATGAAAWPARHAHSSVVHAGRMWVLGGNAYFDIWYNDVWYSTDGATWTEAASTSIWPARAVHTSVVHGGAMWVIGGQNESGHTGHLNDVWYGLEPVPQGEYQYVYDDVQRLTDIRTKNGITISYEYHPAGNRLQKEVTSQLLLSAGDANPPSGGVDNSAVDEPIMQLALDVSGDEDLTLNQVELGATGTGNDATAISEAKLWRDANGDGAVDGGDSQLGSNATFSGDNGVVIFSGLAETLSAGQRTDLLLTYTFNGSALENESFGVSLSERRRISAEGAVSGEAIYALGAPVTGATLTVSTDTTAPAFAGLQTATPQDGAVYLEWLEATDLSTPITYRIWQSTESFAGTVTGPPDYTTSALNHLVEGLMNGQTYYFVVRAEDNVGNRDDNAEERSATPEGVIHNLAVTAVNGTVTKSPDLGGYEEGTYVSLAAMGDAGYHFAGWSGDVPAGHEILNPLTLLMDADKTLDAAFVRSTGTVVVAVTPNDATWSFLDGAGAEHPGEGDDVVAPVSTGQIVFTWDPYPGYTPPPMALPELVRGGTVTVTGVYGEPLSFTAQPQGLTRYTGETAQFTVGASGGLGELHYQWKFDNAQKAMTDVGTDSPVLTLHSLALGDAGAYWCEVGDEVPATYVSASATLIVGEHLQITEHPESADKYVGHSQTFSVTTTGGIGATSYEWQKDGGALPEGTEADYTITNLRTHHVGTYSVTVSDENTDVVESNTALLTVTAGLPLVGVAGLGALAVAFALGAAFALRRR